MPYKGAMKRREKGNNAGFTFLEVLVALCVVSISIVALLNCHTVSLRNYVKSQIMSRATLLAEEKINEIESKSFQRIDDSEAGAGEYENGLLYMVDVGDFYDEEETEVYQPGWRLDYWWLSIAEETEYEGVRKVTVEVFFGVAPDDVYSGNAMNIDPWSQNQARPIVRLVTYIASTNTREDARSGPAPSRRAGRSAS
jgi:prepilin-type N-terminal cleavage/methylation domain-containing protein